jgi:hypothetical protein
MTAMGDVASLDPKGSTRRNILGIKQRCPLVNLSNGDYADPRVIIRLLQDKVPLPGAAAATPGAPPAETAPVPAAPVSPAAVSPAPAGPARSPLVARAQRNSA